MCVVGALRFVCICTGSMAGEILIFFFSITNVDIEISTGYREAEGFRVVVDGRAKWY